jgi:hypothetical protein
MSDRTKAIVAAQVHAAELQAACKWMPPENFFPNMVGHIGIVFGPELAAQIVTIFEMARQEHEEMLDGMMRDPKGAAKAFTAGLENYIRKRGAA